VGDTTKEREYIEMVITKITTDEIEALIRPAMEWLNNNCHPCVRITIEPDRFTVSEHVCSVPILDYVSRRQTEIEIRYEIADGVVLDCQTDLIWQKNYTGPMPWDEAMAYPATLGPEWMLPTAHDLFGLVDLNRNAPASTFPGMPKKSFWSSSYTSGSSYAWYVNFDDGYVSDGNRANGNYVRCVRSGPKKVRS